MKDYDPRKPSKFTTYLDMNNFYGWARVIIFLMVDLSG